MPFFRTKNLTRGVLTAGTGGSSSTQPNQDAPLEDLFDLPETTKSKKEEIMSNVWMLYRRPTLLLIGIVVLMMARSCAYDAAPISPMSQPMPERVEADQNWEDTYGRLNDQEKPYGDAEAYPTKDE